MLNQKKQHKPKVILAIIEGLGLSASWRGNALLTAKLPTLSRFWLNYPHLTLKTFDASQSEIGIISSPQTNHASIATGNICLSGYDFINKQISGGEFYRNTVIAEAIDYAEKNFSAVHLIGNLSQNGLFGSRDHLKALLNLFVHRKSCNCYVHIIFDETHSSKNEILEMLQDLEKMIAQLPNAGIASVAGIRNLHSRNYVVSDSLRSVLRKDPAALSAEQAVNLFYNEKAGGANLPFVAVKEGGKTLGAIKDFDSVIFFNHNPAVLEQTIFNLALEGFGTNRPRSLRITLLTDQISQLNAEIKIAFRQQFQNNLCRILAENNIRQFLISSSLRIDYFNKYFIFPRGERNAAHFAADRESNYNFDAITASWHSLGLELIKRVGELETGFIIFDVPYLNYVSKYGTFSQLIALLEKIDADLAALESAVIRNDALLLLTSNHRYDLENYKANLGGIEKTRVPLLAVSDLSKNLSQTDTGFASRIIYDLLKDDDHALADIAPTILHLFGLTKPESMSGKSLLLALFSDLC